MTSPNGTGSGHSGSNKPISRWGMGILNDKQTDEVPGSVLLLSKTYKRNEPLGLRHVPARTSSSSLPSPLPTPRDENPLDRALSKKLTKDGTMILEPQPDDSMNDPLNWPAWRRDIALLSLGFYCMLGGGMTPVIAAGFTDVAIEFDVTIPDVALTTGIYMLGMGVGCVIASPTAILYGKRPVYLVTAIIFIISSIWCAVSPTYISLVLARIVQGMAVSAVECLPSATVAEIFFLHERAYRLGIYTLLLLGGKNLVPLVSAAIINSLGWRWVFWIVAIIVGFGAALLFFFVPETFWDRTPRPHHGVHIGFGGHHEKHHGQQQPASAPAPPQPEINPGIIYTDHYRNQPSKSYAHSLKPFNGRLSHSKWHRVAIRPFILFTYPAVLWSSLVYALSVGWLIVLSESVAHIYRDRDTYNFTALQVGLVYISPFVGGILGTAVAGYVSDIIVRWMSRRNDGIYEPEFRLVMGIPIAISTTIGLMGFGWSVDEHNNWIVPTIFFGVISFGCSLGSTTAITFCVDSYRQYAGEALVTLNFSKNIFHGLVFSLFFGHWLESDGPKRVFVALGAIQMACLLFTIPMYIYGKRARMWTVRKNMMEKF